jgi:hypothetical protein
VVRGTGGRGNWGTDRKFTEPRRPEAVLRGKLPVPKFPVPKFTKFSRQLDEAIGFAAKNAGHESQLNEFTRLKLETSQRKKAFF